MALSVDYNYQFVLKLIRKNQAGGLDNEEFQFHWNDAQNAYMDDMLGRFQARNNGKTGVNTGLIQDETILQKLSPFTKPVTINIVAAGKVDKPLDFVYRLAFRIMSDSSLVDLYKINHNQIGNFLADVIDPPSITDKKFYFVEYEDYYQLIPSGVPVTGTTTCDLDYIMTPPNVVWGFTFGADGEQIYNAGTSVQPLWDNHSQREICKRVLKNLGVSFHDNEFSNFGQSVINSGD